MAAAGTDNAPPRRWGDESALFDEVEARRRLLDATGCCIVRAGSASIRVADVADEAGVSRSTVYRYYSSRDQLVAGLMLARTDAAYGRIVASLPDPGIAAVTIPELVLAPVGLVEGNPLNEALFTAESRGLVVSSLGFAGDETDAVSVKHFGPLFDVWQATGQIHADLDLVHTLRWLNATAVLLLSPPWTALSADERRVFVQQYVVRALLCDQPNGG